MNFRDWHKEIRAFEWVNIIIGIATLICACIIGFTQNEINAKLASIQDSVEVFGYAPLITDKFIVLRITNVGNIQVYVSRYFFDDVDKKLPDVLIPAGQQQDAWYDLILPRFQKDTEKLVTVEFKDQLNRQWRSEIDMTTNSDGAVIVNTEKIIPLK
jgi:hypothetical protein